MKRKTRLSQSPEVEKRSKKVAAEHSPAPQPERAIYGFFLLVSAIFTFILYLIIAYVPHDVFEHELGWDYLPDKYWCIAVPALIIISLLMVLPIYMSINMKIVNDPESINNITDEMALDKQTQISANPYQDYSIDPIYDIPITDINRFLFLRQ